MAHLKERRKQVGEYRLMVDTPDEALWFAGQNRGRPDRRVQIVRGMGWWVVRAEQRNPPGGWILMRSISQPDRHSDALKQAYDFMKKNSRKVN